MCVCVCDVWRYLGYVGDRSGWPRRSGQERKLSTDTGLLMCLLLKRGGEDNDDKSPRVQLEHLQIEREEEENVFRERGSDFPPPVSLSSTGFVLFLVDP